MQTNVEPLGLEVITILAVIPLFATLLAILCCHNTTSNDTSTSPASQPQDTNNGCTDSQTSRKPIYISPSFGLPQVPRVGVCAAKGYQLNEAENLHEGESLGTNAPASWLAFNNLKDIFMQVTATKQDSTRVQSIECQ